MAIHALTISTDADANHITIQGPEFWTKPRGQDIVVIVDNIAGSTINTFRMGDKIIDINQDTPGHKPITLSVFVEAPSSNMSINVSHGGNGSVKIASGVDAANFITQNETHSLRLTARIARTEGSEGSEGSEGTEGEYEPS
jgi:hypothetical protein